MNQSWLSPYSQKGYAVVPSLFCSEEISLLSRESQRLWDTCEDLTPFNLRVGLRHNGKGEPVLERLDPVSDISRLFGGLLTDNRFSGTAELALKGAVLPLKDKLIYKWPGCNGYGLHRDEPYFGISGVPGSAMVSIALAIDGADKSNGAIEFFPSLRRHPLPSPENEPRDVDSSVVSGIRPDIPALKPGDMVIFDGFVPHRSTANLSARSRRMFTVTYASKSYADCYERYYAERRQEQTIERKRFLSGRFYFR